ncbi:MAG TPA: M23 family metallopeptidase [Thermoanaerobaculia bacterium]
MRPLAWTILYALVAGPMFAEDERAPYAFYPMSGIVGKDVFLTYAVDLDSTSGIRDFDCSQYTYNGHRGIDVTLESFRQQDIGMPVFAALDGTVVATHDGDEFDRRLDGGGNSAGNAVVLRHKGTHMTRYFHLRNGSVAVVPGQFVTAGTQLGLAASSGTSSWPHLHFQSEYEGAHYEPSAGPCREGPSYWTNPNQVLLERSFHAGEFGFSSEAYEVPATRESLAEDRQARTGTYVHGSTIHYRLTMRNVPPQTSSQMRLRRPDGTIAVTRNQAYGNAALLRLFMTRGSFDLEADVLGLWRLEIAFNGATMVTAPFLVVASSSEIENRAPHAIGASIKPANLTVNDVPRCEVETSLLFEDPDYDVIRYRYEWFVGDRLVRDVTSGGLMDALPRDAARPGDRITCRVTPSDGMLEGPTATAEGKVALLLRRRAVAH